MNKIAVAEELKMYFLMHDLSQKDVAQKINVQPPFVNNILSGRRKIGRQVAERLHQAFGFNKMWLLTGEGEMFAETPSKQESPTNEQVEQRIEQLETEIVRLQSQLDVLIKLINASK